VADPRIRYCNATQTYVLYMICFSHLLIKQQP
jgi:hypothetical protein